MHYENYSNTIYKTIAIQATCNLVLAILLPTSWFIDGAVRHRAVVVVFLTQSTKVDQTNIIDQLINIRPIRDSEVNNLLKAGLIESAGHFPRQLTVLVDHVITRTSMTLTSR